MQGEPLRRALRRLDGECEALTPTLSLTLTLAPNPNLLALTLTLIYEP